MAPSRSWRIAFAAATVAVIGIAGGAGTANAAPSTMQPKFVQVATGGQHSLLVTDAGTLYSVGYNKHGQLGHPREEDASYSTAPGVVDGFPRGTRIAQASAGSDFSLALASDGKVYSWGHNIYGQLGNGSTASSSSPTQVQGVPADDPVTHISTTSEASYVVTTSGRVFQWGKTAISTQGSAADSLAPVELKFPSNPKIVKVSNHVNVGLALTDSGQVYSWTYAMSGDAGRPGPLEVPALVTGLPAGDPIVDVGGVIWQSAVATASGKVYTWDTTMKPGTSGPGSAKLQTSAPVRVDGFQDGDPVVALGTGIMHNIALTASGAVFSWRSNAHGELGNGKMGQSSEIAVRGLGVPADDPVTGVAAGGHTSLVVTRSGGVYGAGLNNVGAIGDQSILNRDVFTSIQIPLSAGSVSVVSSPDGPAGEVLAQVTPGPGWPSAATLSYQWNRNGEAIAEANAATYTQTQEDADAEITVAVTVTAVNHAPHVLVAGPVAPTGLSGNAISGIAGDLADRDSSGASVAAQKETGLAGTGANSLLLGGIAAAILGAGIIILVVRRRVMLQR